VQPSAPAIVRIEEAPTYSQPRKPASSASSRSGSPLESLVPWTGRPGSSSTGIPGCDDFG
jgi:hypothetical protein